MLRSPAGGTNVELSRFLRPDHVPGPAAAMPNQLGLRNVCFEVDRRDGLLNWRSVIIHGWFEELHGEEASRALTLFFERASASRTRKGPSKRPSEFCGRQPVGPAPSGSASSASRTNVAGVTPCSRAAEYRKGLKLEPGCRQACVT